MLVAPPEASTPLMEKKKKNETFKHNGNQHVYLIVQRVERSVFCVQLKGVKVSICILLLLTNGSTIGYVPRELAMLAMLAMEPSGIDY